MSLRKTSCLSCVAAKRRCDLERPTCARCRKKNAACQYPYPPPPNTQDQIASSSTTSDSHFLGVSDIMIVDSCIDRSTILYPGEEYIDPLLWFPDGPTSPAQGWAVEPDEWLSQTRAIGGLSPSLLPRLERRVLEFWPRVNDTQTWRFCSQTFLGYVDHFLNTGTLPVVESSTDSKGALSAVLREAYGVCAAYRTCQHAAQPFYLQLLKAGINNADMSNLPQAELQDQLDHLQALILYFIIFLAGGVGDQSLFVQLDYKLAQGTADLERRELELRHTSSSSHLKSKDLCEDARRLILVSYLVRAVHAVVHFHRCDFIKYLAGLPVSTQSCKSLCFGDQVDGGQLPTQSTSRIVSYDELVGVWEQGGLLHVDDFKFLLLVACKGLDTVQGKILGT
ncbi:Zn(II)2Cys6 transcription factor domain-containing protein [Aspergillus vadensis CBS 113365]|uniref:C6 finger domain protein n=1 Tax=Aspergillus vadensis (strain CBS 113365 / IMI 142717 / IBT 24658) TaxID=1448311 RepID=A0A319B522_ASPVC|nr:C6 finger domain protein [Aspergillus vadensis CBS 113365]PYH67886.1 C6 finger domain protein [Aspergillus vadensis CBS 113365]